MNQQTNNKITWQLCSIKKEIGEKKESKISTKTVKNK